MGLEKLLKTLPKSEKGFYILLLTLAAQTCLERAIDCFKRGERTEGKRQLAKAIRFAFWSAVLTFCNKE
jgi:Tfp pilus assembly pilus retraction ATPase PilT